MEIVIQETKQELLGPQLNVIGIGDAGAKMVAHTLLNSSYHKDVVFSCIGSSRWVDDVVRHSDIVIIATSFEDEESMLLATDIATEARSRGSLVFSIIKTPSKEIIGDFPLKEESSIFSLTPCDDMLAIAVEGISIFLLSIEERSDAISLDFADLRNIMTFKGLAYLGIGEGGEGCTSVEVAKKALAFPYDKAASIKNASAALIHFTVHPEYPMDDLNEALKFIGDNLSDDADCIFGTKDDKSMDVGMIKMVVLITGFETDSYKKDDSEIAFDTPPSRKHVNNPDELLEEAKHIVLKESKVSIVYLQRHLQRGYNRTAEILKQLEAIGIVSPPNAKGVRKVLR